MDTTVGKLKIGAPLVMGKYSVANDGTPQPIIWLKATPNSDFITQCAVDYLCFDAREQESDNRDCRYGGNSNYRLSNLLSFVNSDCEEWFHPTHQYDAPPSRRNGCLDYKNHYGFLYYFEDYEVESLVVETREVEGNVVSAMIRLPSLEDIFGHDRFKLFSKKGLRPKGTEDLIQARYMHRFDYDSYFPFWLAGPANNSSYASTVSRSGGVDRPPACSESGLRPVCTINKDTPVTQDEAGLYHIKPNTVRTNVCTDRELFDFLGMAQP